MKPIALAAIALSLALTAGTTLAATPLGDDPLIALEVASKDYVAVGGDLVILCEAEAILGFCLGGASFSLTPDTYNIEIRDDLNPAVAGVYAVDGGPTDLFCGSISNVFVESHLEVWVDQGFALAQPSCPNTDSFGTTGEIRVT